MNAATKPDITPLTPVQQFRKVLEGSMRSEVAKQLPKGVDPDRFIRTAITTVQMQPELLEANRSSLFAACMQAAKDGLLPDGREATIQIYNTKVGNEWVKQAQYMPMVGGLIKKMYAAGVQKIDGVAVYEKDEFIYELGDEPKITHKPYWGSQDRGQVMAAYAIVKLENGEVKREVMGRGDIDKVREASKSSNGPGWTNWYDQFAIKAVLKRVYKQVPGRNDEFESVAQADNEALGITFDHDTQSPEAPAQTPTSSAKRIASKIKAKVGVEDSAPPAATQSAEQDVEDDSSLPFEDAGENVDTETGEITLDKIPGIKKASELTDEQKAYVDDMEGDKSK